MSREPHEYSEELVDEVCARLMTKQSLQEICDDPAMPSESAWYKWLSQNRGSIVEKYERARAIQVERFTDEIVPIADSVAFCTDPTIVQAAKLRMDGRKWVAAKRLSKKYGDRLQTDNKHTHDVSDPLAALIEQIATGGAKIHDGKPE